MSYFIYLRYLTQKSLTSKDLNSPSILRAVDYSQLFSFSGEYRSRTDDLLRARQAL
jgi:hypothetical protein